MDIGIEYEESINLYKKLDPLNKGVIYFSEFDKLFE